MPRGNPQLRSRNNIKGLLRRRRYLHSPKDFVSPPRNDAQKYNNNTHHAQKNPRHRRGRLYWLSPL